MIKDMGKYRLRNGEELGTKRILIPEE